MCDTDEVSKENGQCLVSVLISILDGEKTMDRAIGSILSQTYENIELIICDDGSKDSTWEKMRMYHDTDSRVVLLRNQNSLGLAASLNRCLAVAKGEYIARQDADDYSEPNRIEKMLSFLQHRKLPFVACGVRISDDHGVWSHRMYPQIITKHEIVKHNPYFHPTMIFRREILNVVDGYRVSKETRRTEDYDLVMRLAAKGIIGENLQEYLYEVYEQREDYMKKHHRVTRWFEFCTRLYGYRKMKVHFLEYLYLLKPLVLCFIPLSLLNTLKRVQWSIKLKGNYHD